MKNQSSRLKRFPEMAGFSIKTDCNSCKHASKCFIRKLEKKEDFANQKKFHINYKKGETIIKEGSHISRILYVVDGLVKVYIEGPDKNIIIRLLKSDDFIELTSLFSDDTYYFSASALTDTLVCSIEHTDLKDLTNQCCNFSRELSKWYCANYNTMLTKCLNLGLRQLNGKLANILLYLNRDEFKEIDIFSHISRKDLAELSGMSQESVARILTEFSKEQIIKINGKRIEITNMEMIQMINQKG